MIEIRTIGGYGEFGRNCTAIKVDNEVILIDLGIHLENYINLTEDDEENKTVQELIWAKAVPDIDLLKDWKDKIVAIVPTHAHLDHVGAIPYLANEFNAPIYSTPFTNAVIRSIITDKKFAVYNPLKVVELNSRHKISNNFEVEFINITHSTPDSTMVVVHTKYGSVVYANDFKIDRTPTLGEESNLERLKEIKEEGNIIALIIESLYADLEGKTPSEQEAKEMLEKLLFEKEDKQGIIVSTFSSHISRLKAIVEIGKKMGRKIIFLGRSLCRYIDAAEECGIVDFGDIERRRYGKEIKKRLKSLTHEKEDYLIVCTGHQGERRAVLSRMAHNELDFRFNSDDVVIFSCTVIPTKENEENREILEDELKRKSVEIYKDVHASGHGSRDDLKEVIDLLKAKFVIPAHGNLEKEENLARASEELGYKLGKTVFVLKNGETLELK